MLQFAKKDFAFNHCQDPWIPFYWKMKEDDLGGIGSGGEGTSGRHREISELWCSYCSQWTCSSTVFTWISFRMPVAVAASFRKPALRGDVLVLFQTPNLDFFLSLLTKSAVVFQIQCEMVMKRSASEVRLTDLRLGFQSGSYSSVCDLGWV